MKVTKTTKTNKRGSQNVTGQRKYYDLIRWLKIRFEDPNSSEKTKDQAIARLQEIYFKIDEERSKAEERKVRLEIARMKAGMGIDPTESPVDPDAVDAKIAKLQEEISAK